jgi:hypothetical protein
MVDRIWSQSTADVLLQFGSGTGIIGVGLFVRFFVAIQAKIHPPTARVLRGLDIMIIIGVIVQLLCLFIPGTVRTVVWNLSGGLFICILAIAGTIWSRRVLNHVFTSASAALREAAKRLILLTRLLQVVVVLQLATLAPYSFLWPTMSGTEYSIWLFWFRSLESGMGMVGLWLMSRVRPPGAHHSASPNTPHNHNHASPHGLVGTSHGHSHGAFKSLKRAQSSHAARVGVAPSSNHTSKVVPHSDPNSKRYVVEHSNGHTSETSDIQLGSPLGSPNYNNNNTNKGNDVHALLPRASSTTQRGVGGAARGLHGSLSPTHDLGNTSDGNISEDGTTGTRPPPPPPPMFKLLN